MHFGIALPSWIVEKENSLWVLGLYGLVFMIALPTVVAIWWYRSSKFSNDQVLLDTTQLYYYFFHKTPHMVFKRALMVLAASLEFEKGHNPEIVVCDFIYLFILFYSMGSNSRAVKSSVEKKKSASPYSLESQKERVAKREEYF